jgi:hypothetical protein
MSAVPPAKAATPARTTTEGTENNGESTETRSQTATATALARAATPAKTATPAKATTEGTEGNGEDTETKEPTGRTWQADRVTQGFALSSRRPFSVSSPLFLGVLCGRVDRSYGRLAKITTEGTERNGEDTENKEPMGQTEHTDLVTPRGRVVL